MGLEHQFVTQDVEMLPLFAKDYKRITKRLLGYGTIVAYLGEIEYFETKPFRIQISTNDHECPKMAHLGYLLMLRKMKLI